MVGDPFRKTRVEKKGVPLLTKIQTNPYFFRQNEDITDFYKFEIMFPTSIYLLQIYTYALLENWFTTLSFKRN